MRLTTIIFFALFLNTIHAAEISKVGTQSKVVIRGVTNQWQLGARACAYHEGRQARCGSVTRILKDNAIVEFDVGSGAVAVGDKVFRSERQPASAGELSRLQEEMRLPARLKHRNGIWAGGNDPHLLLIGLNYGYHIEDWLRWQIGVGTTQLSGTASGAAVDVRLFGAGTSFRVATKGWIVNPTFGVGFSSLFGAASFTSVLSSSASSVFMNLYLSAGVDYQADFGLNLQLGWHKSLTLQDIIGAPYIAAGWYF